MTEPPPTMLPPWGATRVERRWAARGMAREDGSGLLLDPKELRGTQGQPEVETVDALRRERCLVLLGEPGSGKSETLRLDGPVLPEGVVADDSVVTLDLAEYGTEGRLASALFDHPKVQAWRSASAGELCVVLDSLDECRERISHLATVLGSEFRRWPTDRLHLRICCRTTDWPESLQQTLKTKFDSVAVYELQPLRREDVDVLVRAAGVDDAEAFSAAVMTSEIGPFAARPLTLALLVRLYARDGRLPAEMVRLYELGLTQLADEPNQARRDAKTTRWGTAAERLAVAGRLAAMSVFGQRDGFWLGLEAESLPNSLKPSDCIGGTETAGGTTVEVSASSVHETLQTGLFASRGESMVGWAHRTFTDYLAARFLAGRQIDGGRLRDLLFAPDGHLYPQVHSIAIWLMRLDVDRYGRLAADDPELLLGSPNDVSASAHRAAAVRGLFEKAASGEFSHRLGQRYDALAYPEIEALVGERLGEGNRQEQELALKIAGGCRLSGLRDNLVEIVLDTSAEYLLRTEAGHALAAIADIAPSPELVTLALAAGGEDDPDDELRGVALRATWPHLIATSEVLESLAPPRRPNLLGAYRGFLLLDLANGLTPADALPGLSWLLDLEESGGQHNSVTTLADRIVAVALDALDDAAVAEKLAQLAVQRSKLHEPLFVDRVFAREQWEVTDSQRRMILAAALSLVTPEDAIALVQSGQARTGLVDPSDLKWLVERFDEVPDERPALARLIQWLFHPEHSGHAALVLDLSSEHDIRTGALARWFEQVELESPEATLRRRSSRVAPPDNQVPSAPSTDDLEEAIGEQLDLFDSGDDTGFWRACHFMYEPQDESDPDITGQERWQQISAETRVRFREAARVYLDVGNCDPDSWLGTGKLWRPAWAGYRALLLLEREEPNRLAELAPETWRRWAPILFALPAAHGGGDWDDKKTLLRRARDAAQEELTQVAISLIEVASENGQPVNRNRELAEIWSAPIVEWLVDALSGGHLHPTTAAELRRLLVQQDAATGMQHLLLLLQGGGEPSLRAEAAGLLLEHDAADSWEAIAEAMSADPEFARQVIFAYLAGAGHHAVPALPDRALADLYLRLVSLFPREGDPNFEDDEIAHFVGPREQAGRLRESILSSLQRRGTPEAVEAIETIERALPQYPWLGYVRREAQLALRTNNWPSVAPAELLELSTRGNARLVHSESQLREVVVAALEKIQERLTGATPEAHLLWNTDESQRRPKDEEDISDYFANRIQDLVVDSGAVVNREVEVRRNGKGIGERTDLCVDAIVTDRASNLRLTVVVEVKGAWHPLIYAAIRNQLAERYMQDFCTDDGIYLVVWPDVDSWQVDERRRNQVASRPLVRTLAKLERRAAEEQQRSGRRIDVVAMDIAWARPDPAG